MTWDTSRWHRARYLELAAALAALTLAVAFNSVMAALADSVGETAHSSPDLLLAQLPVVDLRWLFVWGFAAFWALAVFAALWGERRRLAHIAWLYALLIFTRGVFIALTPMRAPEGSLSPAGDPLYDLIGRYLTFGNDLFFSSHTALPYMGYLAYRDPRVRYAFLALSVSLAATVLFTRLHYSIDVFAAYFITYALYRYERRRLRAPYRRLRHAVLRRWAS